MQEIVRKQRQMRQEKCKCGHVEVYIYIYTVYGLYVEVYIIINYMNEHVFVCGLSIEEIAVHSTIALQLPFAFAG